MEAAMNPAEKKACDTCRTGPSILYCRSDSTFLCGDCDAGGHVHHAQVWLCQVCERSPAAVTCKADAAALCTACDADIHSANLLARRHERVPVVPFFFDSGGLDRDQIKADCFLGFGDYMKSTDCFFSDVDPYLDLEYADSMVPVQQQQQEEMKGCDDGVAVGVLRQHVQPVVDFDSGRSNNGSSYSTYSVCSSEVGVVPDANRRLGSVQTSVMAGMDRGARVMRYREKRKSRRFEKTIRYVSRKAYAETRPRIKGRFAKRTEVEADGKLLMDGGYGVVPSF